MHWHAAQHGCQHKILYLTIECFRQSFGLLVKSLPNFFLEHVHAIQISAANRQDMFASRAVPVIDSNIVQFDRIGAFLAERQA